MRSTNRKSPNNSSRFVEALVSESIPDPPPIRPQCGIWAEPGRVEIMFRLDSEGQHYQHLIVEVPASDGSLPAVHGKGADSIPMYVTVERASRLCGFAAGTLAG